MVKAPILTTCKKGYVDVTIKANEWTALAADKEPYKYGTTVVLENVEATHNVVYELVNTNPVLFSKYGFAINEGKYNKTKIEFNNKNYAYKIDVELVIYAVEQPTEDVTLTIAVEV